MKLIKLNDVKKLTQLGESTIYKLMEKGNFPLPVNLGIKVRRWRKQDIIEWINNLPSKQNYKKSNQFKKCKCCKLYIGGQK